MDNSSETQVATTPTTAPTAPVKQPWVLIIVVALVIRFLTVVIGNLINGGTTNILSFALAVLSGGAPVMAALLAKEPQLPVAKTLGYSFLVLTVLIFLAADGFSTATLVNSVLAAVGTFGAIKVFTDDTPTNTQTGHGPSAT